MWKKFSYFLYMTQSCLAHQAEAWVYSTIRSPCQRLNPTHIIICSPSHIIPATFHFQIHQLTDWKTHTLEMSCVTLLNTLKMKTLAVVEIRFKTFFARSFLFILRVWVSVIDLFLQGYMECETSVIYCVWIRRLSQPSLSQHTAKQHIVVSYVGHQRFSNCNWKSFYSILKQAEINPILNENHN